MGSESRLKAYLDSRGVPVPQGSKRDELLAQVRLNKHKAATGWSAWTFDTWTVDNLRKYLESHGKKAKKYANANRDELLKQAQDQYASASKSYLDSYGVPNYQGSTTNELRALAKKQANYFRYGTTSPTGSIFEQIKSSFQWLLGQARGTAASAGARAAATGSSAASQASKSATDSASSASSAASQASESATNSASSASSEL